MRYRNVRLPHLALAARAASFYNAGQASIMNPTGNSDSERAYSAGHFALDLFRDNSTSFLRSVEGGAIKTDILTYQQGPNRDLWRSLGRTKFDDIKLQVGWHASHAFWAWLSSFVSGDTVRHDGAVIAADFKFRERVRQEFKQALIKELQFPKLEGKQTEPVYMTVTLVPELLEVVKGDLSPITSPGSGAQKLYANSNFSFRIDGYEEVCRQVTSVEGFTIKQEVHDYFSGNRREPLRVPGIVEYPNISFTLPESAAHAFVEQQTKSARAGRRPMPRLTGAIVLHTHTAAELCTVSLEGIDIASITPDKSDAASKEFKQVKVEITVEKMTLDYAELGKKAPL